jgi:hypothetical protein
VCGVRITDIDIDHGHSALEALCVSPQGNGRLQLVRQLLSAALNSAGGGATFTNFARCNAVCIDSSSSGTAIGSCIDAADAFNNGGDNLPASFDTGGSANSEPCNAARRTTCTVLSPSSCASP